VNLQRSVFDQATRAAGEREIAKLDHVAEFDCKPSQESKELTAENHR
jgi:hypothetical protein